ncbi:uncharacterized protein CCR75_000114 [Bremia lactucae]|uniref:Integrase catalytic domain-containing protein n=1 Tax=Bremia lactucae TaxID=4779 RepID=A0A976IIL5_BRELC|nr:hypothetical protein CCR75_000114 [Bremia lactucae]
MSDIFKAFCKLLKMRTIATFAYRSQANKMVERMVGTITRTIKIYNRARDESAAYLAYGRTPRTALKTAIPKAGRGVGGTDAKKWQIQVQKQHRFACARTNELMEAAIFERIHQGERERRRRRRIGRGRQLGLAVLEPRQAGLSREARLLVA